LNESSILSGDTPVDFELPVIEGVTYQWQLNTGSDWTNLSNNATYIGVETNTLSISSAPYGFNNYRYRCMLTGPYCSEPTRDVLLQVIPVGVSEFVSSSPELLVYPNPAGLNVTYIIKGMQTQKLNLTIANLYGQQLYQVALVNQDNSSVDGILDMSGYQPGVYILQLIDQNKVVASAKIVRKL